MTFSLKKHIAGYFSYRQFNEPGGYKEIWQVAWPLVIMNASNTMMMVINRWFLSKQSTADVAAAVPAGQFFFTMMSFFLITTTFTATLVAQNYGKEDKIGCIKSAWGGFYFGLIVAGTVGIFLPTFGSWIIHAMSNGADPNIVSRQVEYFVALSPCAGLACLETAFLSFFIGRGQTKIVGALKVGSCLVSVPLNYLFIFGVLGVPALGIVGAGLASTLASLLSVIAAALCYFLYNQNDYPTRQYRGFDGQRIMRLLKFGAPAGLQTCVRNSAFAIVLMMVGQLGREQWAALSIAMIINMIGGMPIIGMLDATSVVTGKYIGKRQLIPAERVVWRALRILYVYMLVAGIMYLIIPETMFRLFSSSNTEGIDFASAVHQGRLILAVMFVGNLLDGLRFLLMGGLRGAGDTRIPLLFSIGTAWLLQLPGSWFLIVKLQAPAWCIWGWITFYVLIDALLLAWRRSSGAWKKIHVITLPPPPPEMDEAD
jgi:MATE family multidrug resistance protein